MFEHINSDLNMLQRVNTYKRHKITCPISIRSQTSQPMPRLLCFWQTAVRREELAQEVLCVSLQFRMQHSPVCVGQRFQPQVSQQYWPLSHCINIFLRHYIRRNDIELENFRRAPRSPGPRRSSPGGLCPLPGSRPAVRQHAPGFKMRPAVRPTVLAADVTQCAGHLGSYSWLMPVETY